MKKKLTRLFVLSTDIEKKCGGCNYSTSTFYGLGKSKKDAKASFPEQDIEYGKGLCSQCMADLIVSEEYEVRG